MNDKPTSPALRGLAATLALLWALLGVGWYRASPWAVALWPWPEVSMSYILLASMAVFIALVWATVAVTGELAALAGAGLNIAVFGVVLGMPWGAGGGGQGQQGGQAAAALAAACAAAGALLFIWARRQPLHDARTTPTVVRLGFGLFTLVLALAGGALVLRQQVFPWLLNGAGMVPIGALFLGAAAYFAYAAAQPRWAHAAPPLWAFLAYDAVLCVPYLQLLGSGGAALDDYYGGTAVNLTSLRVYLGVIGLSAALALYALLLHPTTRLWRRPRATPTRR